MKDGRPNFWVETNLQNVSIIWSPLLYFNLKSSIDPYNSSFIRFHSFLHESWLLLSESLNFWKVKRGDRISGGRPILQNVSIIWSPLLYFNFKTFLDANSSTFIRFQSFLLQSGVLFSGPRNFCKLKWGDLISRRNRLCRMSQLFGPLLYFNLKRYMDQNSFLFSSCQSFLHKSGVLF